MLAPIDTLLAAPPPFETPPGASFETPFGTPLAAAFDLPVDPSQFALPADHHLPVLYLGLAAVLLLAGRRLFWLSLGLAGFVAGLVAMTYVDLPASSPVWTPWAAAAIFGLLGALLAIFVQRVVVGAVGFVAGGLGALWLAATFAWPVETWAGSWGWLLVFCVGGGVLAALAGYLFEAALIVLSALAGAALITAVTQFDAQVDLVLFPALALLGMLVQTGTFGQRSDDQRPRRRGGGRRRRRREHEQRSLEPDEEAPAT